MKFLASVSLVLSLASFSLAQDLSSIPSCASGAVLSSIGSTGCQLTNLACICKNTAFLNSLLPEIQKACSPSDLQKTEVLAQALCASASVTITIPSGTAAPATAAPSGSPSATSVSGTSASVTPTGSSSATGSATGSPSGSTSSPSASATIVSSPASGASSSFGVSIGLVMALGAFRVMVL